MNQRLKDQLAHFGRTFALLLNRTLMYQASHPVIKQSIVEMLPVATRLLESVSPLVFILNRGQFFTDEEPLDPRINVGRTVALFKSSGLQSICFEKGLTDSELSIFSEVFASLTRMSNAEMVKDALVKRGVFNIKVNHVIFKKVTEDDQVVSREALKKVTPMLDADNQEERKRFMETLLESVLSEEFAKTLNITNLMANPAAFTQKMIQADLDGALQMQREQTPQPSDIDAKEDTGTLAILGEEQAERSGGGLGTGPGGSGSTGGGEGTGTGGSGIDGTGGTAAAGTGPGTSPGAGTGAGAATGQGHGALLIHQLEMMHQEVEKHLRGEGEIGITDLAQAIFDMKRQLLEGLQAQKALGIAYTNEAAILDAANKLTDEVLLELIKEEYQAGKITTRRLASIILRMIPEAADLKRLLPKIKKALLGEGMPPAEYLKLVHELRDELQNEELTRILIESSEAIGLDGETLIDEVKRNPSQAAELIYLASEIRKGGGDEATLSNILVEYVEQIGKQMAKDASSSGSADGEAHMKRVMADVESTLLKKMGQMNVSTDLMASMEARINERMESILDSMRVQWLNTQAGAGSEKPKMLSVLQTLEHNVGEDEELAAILKAVRTKVEAGDIEENNFSQIHEEINRHKGTCRGDEEENNMPEGVLDSDDLMFILEKEIARTKRYGAPFSALAFAFVTAKPKMKSLEVIITNEAVIEAALGKLASTFRSVDYIGQLGRNKMLALLPMAGLEEARKALARVLRLLHGAPLDVNGVPVQLRVAGVVAAYDAAQALDAKSFAKHLFNQLADMVARVRNIQVLF
jgi:hypothetical protein